MVDDKGKRKLEGADMGEIDEVDVAIVGAGTAGLAALREVRAHTDKFVLINAGPYGTTCARVGCMPSKALIAAAMRSTPGRSSMSLAFAAEVSFEPDIPAVLRRVRSLRDDFVSGVLKATEDLGTRNIAGHARLEGANRLDRRRAHYPSRSDRTGAWLKSDRAEALACPRRPHPDF